MGTSLTNDANKWFNHTVDTNDPSSPDWTFEEVVIVMKNRFVHRALAQDASNQYDGFSQSKRSVMEYYNMLRSYAQHMIEPPSAYDFRQRFISGLLPSIYRRLLEYGLASDYTPIDDILKVALQIETSMQYAAREPATTGSRSMACTTDGPSSTSKTKVTHWASSLSVTTRYAPGKNATKPATTKIGRASCRERVSPYV